MFLRARERVLVRLVRDKQGESGVTDRINHEHGSWDK